MDKLKEKLKDVPKLPGVYQFKGKNGEVLYVGKAKNLKARIGQYLAGRDEREQIPYLLKEAADFDYTVVNNELESLFLESTLIKKYLPRYNIMLRDDKNYAFIKIDYSTEIPQIQIVRKADGPKTYKLKPKSYFGPYTAAYKIRNTLNLVRRIFPYCSAQKVGSRPCFYYYLHRCPGVCIGKISLDEYKKHLGKIADFLAGNVSKVKKELAAEMKAASKRQQFEKAARLRDQCNALEILEQKQSVILPKKVDWDIVSLAFEAGYACVNLFKVREGKLFDRENFVYSDPELRNPSRTAESYEADIIQTFLEKYYLETSNAPKTVYTQIPATDAELIAHIVRSRFNKKTGVIFPQKGKPAELARLGQTNAAEYLKNWLKNSAEHRDRINAALTELKEVLHLEKIPERIEGYDISNIQGSNAVGSMVVFKNGLPAKSEYRKFRIRSKSTPDDFAMMREMLARRLSRLPVGAGLGRPTDNGRASAAPTADKSFWAAPDLIVIDGGKGQLSAAMEALDKYQISNIKYQTIGLAKRIEEIFLPGRSNPIVLPETSPALQLLQRLRDEAHRFSITYHRQLRSKQAVRSALDDIPGIGPKTKKLLKQKFGTVKNIRQASLDELAAVVGEHLAQLIQQSL
ncbi:MAG: excinuclease ABC subunit UvrC [Patescibacteria group bacterium]|nr:excinuclease ABC subunit UvrC [Patescibacteria group bacterium]